MRREGTLASVASAALLAVAAVTVARAADARDAGATARACRGLRIGLLAPLSGPAALSGREQVRWARLATRRHNRSHPRLRFHLVVHDTALDSEQASARARQLAADGRVLAVVGPAGSQEVPAVGSVLSPRSIAFVSGSARAPGLTVGRERVRGFFRVVASDLVQAPLLARFAAQDLSARRAVVIDDGTAYGRGLAALAQRRLTAARVGVTRRSLDAGNDLGALVASIPAETDTVLLLWSSASQAAAFAVRLRREGKTATVLGGDRLDSAEWLSVAEGHYFASFAPDLRAFEDAKTVALVHAYTREFGPWETNHGPPVFVAVQVVQAALKRACRDGKASRQEVGRHVRQVRFASILRYTIRFRGGDVPGARFFVYRVTDGRATLAR